MNAFTQRNDDWCGGVDAIASGGDRGPPGGPVNEGVIRTLAIAFAVSVSLVFVACGNSDATPQAAAPTAAYGTFPPGYPTTVQGQQQTPPGYPPSGYPPGYATAAPQYPAPAPAYPQPSPAPAATYTAAPVATYVPPTPTAPVTPAPAAPPTATLSTPGLLALPCQSDAICGLHHCNTQYNKCAFPCQTAVDCVSNNCVMGVCLPGGGS